MHEVTEVRKRRKSDLSQTTDVDSGTFVSAENGPILYQGDLATGPCGTDSGTHSSCTTQRYLLF